MFAQVLFYLRNDINDGEVGVKVAEGHGAKLRDGWLNLLMAKFHSSYEKDIF